MADLTVGFVGLGSIGRRHLGNLFEECERRRLDVRAVALRHSPGAGLDERVASRLSAQFFSADEMPVCDLLFICNPTQLHKDAAESLHGRAGKIFLEKPAFSRHLSEGELAGLGDVDKYRVACPLRHTKTFADLKGHVTSSRVFSARSICSSYLPGWRSGVDYRSLYCARPDSGGVVADLVHEFDYLVSLFGFPLRSALYASKVSDLEIESTDVAVFIAEYADKMVELHLDYFGRRSQRSCEVISRDGTETFDFLDEPGGMDGAYKREMRDFLDFALEGGANINSLRFANDVLGMIQEGLCNMKGSIR